MLMIARAANVRCSTPGLIIGFWSAENSNWATAPFDDGRDPIELDVLYWAELELPSNIPLITNAVAERRSASSH